MKKNRLGLSNFVTVANAAGKGTIEIASVSMSDEKISIRLHGINPDQIVTVHAIAKDETGIEWASFAKFKADSNGNVDLGTQKPLSGTYDEIDPMGLFWSMEPQSEEGKFASFVARDLEHPVIIKFVLEAEGQVIASESIERSMIAPNILREEVREDGLVGTFFHPDDDSSYPGIIILGGSDGGMYEYIAAQIASHGYATMCLTYFINEENPFCLGIPGSEHLPKALSEIPVEYFGKAIHWLQKQKSVESNKVALFGYSMGGNIGLLLGSIYPEIKAVAGVTASGFVWQGLDREGMKIKETSSLTYQGKPLPYLPYKMPWSMYVIFPWSKLTHKPIKMISMYTNSIKEASPDTLEKTTIPVEKINGPVLLFSGELDYVWPSPIMSEMVMKRLAQHKHPYPYESIVYKGAGHAIAPPYKPTVYIPSKLFLAYNGGSPKVDYHANVKHWKRLLQFFEESL